jgi:drug/metabolite transporter (DMT)-like permease
MVAATLLWGATFVVIRDSLHAIAPVPLVCVRFVLASLVLIPLAAWRRRFLTRATIVGGALAGLCFGTGFVFQAIGLTRASAGSSAFLTCAGTLFAAFYAWPLLGQRPSLVLLQGVALALAGSLLLSAAVSAPWHLGIGELWTLAGAAVFGLQVVVLAWSAPRADGLVLATVQALTIALLLLPFAAGALRQIGELRMPDLARLAYLVVAGSLVAPLLQIFAQGRMPAGRVALLFALEPVFALAFALTLGGERFSPRWWLGAALILTGVVRVEWDAARGSRERAPLAESPSSSSAT